MSHNIYSFSDNKKKYYIYIFMSSSINNDIEE